MPVNHKDEPETANVRENAFLRGRTCSGDPAHRLAAKASAFMHEAPVRAERISAGSGREKNSDRPLFTYGSGLARSELNSPSSIPPPLSIVP